MSLSVRGRSICTRCEACQMAYAKQSPVKKPSYVILGENHTRILSRPSSADQYVRSSYISNANEKSASISDSKIEKTYQSPSNYSRKSATVSAKNKKQRYEIECSQLKDDLSTIKEQLLTLTRNKDEALQISTELQNRYQTLLKRTQEQERLIEDLKRHNDCLIDRLNTYAAVNNRFNSNTNSVNTSAVFECPRSASIQYESSNSSRLSEAIRESDVKYSKLLLEYQKVKENELRYAAENNELAQTVDGLEIKLNRAMAELRKYQNESRLSTRQHQDLRKQNDLCLEQIKQKAEQISELNKSLEQLRQQMCTCKIKAEELTHVDQTNKKLRKQNAELMAKLKAIQDNEEVRLKELDGLKDSERKLAEELMKLKNFSQDLSKMSEESHSMIANLRRSNQEKEELMQKLQAECVCKEKQLENFLKVEEQLNKKNMQLHEELICAKMSAQSHISCEHSPNCCCKLDLATELKDLINALYDEIEKTMTKDEHIQKQNKNICCLKCAIMAKDKEISNLREEMNIIKEEYVKSVEQQKQDNQAGAQQETGGCQEEESNSSSEGCECGECESYVDAEQVVVS